MHGACQKDGLKSAFKSGVSPRTHFNQIDTQLKKNQLAELTEVIRDT
jgi:hypothetical protein